MTWTWKIDHLGTETQTLRVFDSDGNEVASVTETSFNWMGDCPDFVYETVANHDAAAALAEDIDRE